MTVVARLRELILEHHPLPDRAPSIAALLDEVARRFGTAMPGADTPVTDLQPLVMPVDAEFRVGTMGLGWDSEEKAVVIELLAITEQELDESVVLADDAELHAVLDRVTALLAEEYHVTHATIQCEPASHEEHVNPI